MECDDLDPIESRRESSRTLLTHAHLYLNVLDNVFCRDSVDRFVTRSTSQFALCRCIEAIEVIPDSMCDPRRETDSAYGLCDQATTTLPVSILLAVWLDNVTMLNVRHQDPCVP